MNNINIEEFKYWFFTKRLSLENLAIKFNTTTEKIENYIKNNNFQRKEYRDGNIITYEELYNWYVVNDGNYLDAPDYFGISRWKFEDLCRKYKIKKDRRKTGKKSVTTRYNKYGGKENYEKIRQQHQLENINQKYGSMDNFNKAKSESCKRTWQIEHEEILDKINKSKRKNNSFNTSKPEDEFYNRLLDYYIKDDIFRQYKDERYPFNCDFYIKSKDLFIELNLNWTHGNHFFNNTNEEDLNLLEYWKERAKTSDFYKNAIHTWTELDVIKKQTAIKNNLNYLTFFNINEIEEWLNEQ